ncbi:MAG: hypothetical protein J3K34DRAFT_462416 [Monoraphidium minutum]|nr:MAG: hypothetical protein J3K34DRAFT_462416 [Monoraphidium minutum]
MQAAAGRALIRTVRLLKSDKMPDIKASALNEAFNRKLNDGKSRKEHMLPTSDNDEDVMISGMFKKTGSTYRQARRRACKCRFSQGSGARRGARRALTFNELTATTRQGQMFIEAALDKCVSEEAAERALRWASFCGNVNGRLVQTDINKALLAVEREQVKSGRNKGEGSRAGTADGQRGGVGGGGDDSRDDGGDDDDDSGGGGEDSADGGGGGEEGAGASTHAEEQARLAALMARSRTQREEQRSARGGAPAARGGRGGGHGGGRGGGPSASPTRRRMRDSEGEGEEQPTQRPRR